MLLAESLVLYIHTIVSYHEHIYKFTFTIHIERKDLRSIIIEIKLATLLLDIARIFIQAQGGIWGYPPPPKGDEAT